MSTGEPSPGPEDGVEGGSCYGNGTCNDGLSCNNANVCEPAPGSVGESCRDDGCDTGLRCVEDICETIPVGSLLGACQDDGSCDEPFICRGDDVCVGREGEESGSCSASGACDVGLSCSDDVCQRIPAGEVGSLCPDGTCNDGLVCSDGVCSSIEDGLVGGGCLPARQCQEGVCDSDNTCRLSGDVAVGGTCERRSDCAALLDCADGNCVEPDLPTIETVLVDEHGDAISASQVRIRTPIQLSAAGSTAVDGRELVAFRWRLLGAPEGSMVSLRDDANVAASVVYSDAAGQERSGFDLVGTYSFEVAVFDNHGWSSTFELEVVLVVGLEFVVAWGADTDLDLHANMSNEQACLSPTRSGGGQEWDGVEGRTSGDPVHQGDVRTAGTEVLTIENAAEGTYWVGVRAYGDASAVVSILVNGEMVETSTENMASNQAWIAYRVVVDGGAVDVVPGGLPEQVQINVSDTWPCVP